MADIDIKKPCIGFCRLTLQLSFCFLYLQVFASPSQKDMRSCSKLLASFVTFVFLAAVNASPYINCTAADGFATDVRVSGCTQSPCILKKGGSVSIEVDFVTNVDATYLTDRVKGIIAGIKLPFNTESPDGCLNKGFTCPINKGQKYTYKSVIPVSTLYPSIRLIVEWALIDQNDIEVFCVKIPAQIKTFL